uniref:Uncharacterized protein n=1 Tax=Plasmid R100 TaxID=28399 RepID=Q46712_9ZZZZ|nr:unknown protein [Plasmid R100]
MRGGRSPCIGDF